MAAVERKVFARKPFKYAGQDLDRGEILTLRATPRDEQLLGLRYLAPFVSNDHSVFQCDGCGRQFITELHRIGHRQKKGGCMSAEQKMTNADIADLLEIDPEKLKMPDDKPFSVDETTETL